MGEIICHNNGKYNIYLIIPDGFKWVKSISLKQLKSCIKNEYGNTGVRRLENDLDVMHRTGTNSFIEKSLKGLISCAGKNKKKLTYQEILKEFF